MRLLIPLFSPATGTWGGLTRVLAITEAAQAAGYEVAFCASGYLETTLRQRGYTVFSVPAATMFGLPRPLSRLIERRSQESAPPVKPGRSIGNFWFVLWLSGFARGRYLQRLVAAELKAVADFKPDALFTDLDPGAFLVRQITGLPMGCNYQDILREGVGSLPWKMMRRAVHSVQKAYQQPLCTPDELHFNPAILKVIPSIPELDGADPTRPDVCYVGHLLGEIQPGAELQPEPGRRYVLVYTGTGSIPLAELKKVLPQVFPADGNTLCVVCAQDQKQPVREGMVEYRSYIPFETLLPQTDWVICHGGQNTIIQALRRGVPLLIFPGAIFERRFNAQKVQAAWAGFMGERDQFTTDWLTAALAKQAECAVQAQALGQQIQEHGGPAAAVAALILWFAQPVQA